MTQEEKEKIIKVLEEKFAKNPCPRCTNQQFSLVDGYFNQAIQQDIKNVLIVGGPSIPAVVVVCNRCGFISQHALGALGLLPQGEEKKS